MPGPVSLDGVPRPETPVVKITAMGSGLSVSWASDAFLSLAGLTPGDLPLPFDAFVANHVHAEDRDRVGVPGTDRLDELFRSGDLRVGCDGLAYRWVRPLPLLSGHSGDRGNLVLAFADLTEDRRRVEELASSQATLERTIEHRNRELSTSSTQYQELMDSSVQGLLVHDGRDILYANMALARVLGYASPMDVLRVGEIWDLFPEEEQERLRGYRKRRIAGRVAPDTYECRMIRRDGSKIWIEIRVSTPMWYGKQAYMVAVTDISERREAEQAMLAARRDAERASELKSDFLAKMSHELRTPLNAIIGFSQSLGATDPAKITQPKLDEYTGYIQQGANLLLHIVNEILDLSKIEAGRYDLVEEPTSLRDVVYRAAGLVSGLTEPRQVTLDIRGLDDDVRVFVDERAMTQVVLNILSNAVKFSPVEATVTVQVEQPDPDEGVNIVIADHGEGIPADKLEHVLTPFGQLGDSDAYRAGGTGLGLPIAKSFIDLHEGELAIESVEGRGTKVTIRLPSFRSLL